MLTIDHWLRLFKELSIVYQREKDKLTALDAAIGDGDHGINMARGFRAVEQQLAVSSPTSVGEVLKIVAMQLIKSVGGASGPLYGAFFLKASQEAGEREKIDATDLLQMWQQGVARIQALGKAKVGDKTMLDFWLPALAAMEGQDDLVLMLRQGCEAGQRGVQGTKTMIAKKGRASYLGERSLGHQDPGATSSYLLLKAAADVFSQ